MKVQSVIAIYFLFWVMSVFVVLPFGMQTADEAGLAKVPGQADSAPVRFNLGAVAIRSTIVSAAVTTVPRRMTVSSSCISLQPVRIWRDCPRW